MLAEILRRLVATIPVMVVVALAVFALLHVTPGDPAVIIAGDYATTEDIARIRTRLGLDQPFTTQVGLWLGRVVRGDLGTSIFSGLPVSTLIGEEGKGFRYLLDGLNAERVLIAAEALGTGRAALRRATAYAKNRTVFGRPIGQNQGIAFPLAEAHARLGAAELAIRHASWRIDQGLPAGEQANLAKFLGAEAGFAAADAAVQTHGGFGYATEYHVERYWREARLLKIAPIPQEMILNYLAEHVLGLPRSY